MADIFSDILKATGGILNQLTTGDILADRKHASKLFVADNFKLVPKFGFLYHVFFDLNQEVMRDDPRNPFPQRIPEIGMMVKGVQLPTFTLDAKRFNAYNRPNYVRGKVTYNPLTITFHDDSSDLIRNFWFDYFNYYYRDSDYPEELYGVPHKYNSTRPTNKWGYSPRNSSVPRYINSIRIYSLSKQHFSEYVLINPVIKSFNHGEHQSGNNDIMSHTMTVEFETVLYYYGRVGPNITKGFADLHYDLSPSPLSVAGGGSRSIFGRGGVLEAADDILYDLARGNYGAAIFKAGRVLQNIRHMDLKKAAIGEVLQIGKDILRGNNPASSIFVPSIPGISNDIGVLGQRIGGMFNGIGGGGTNNNWLVGAAGLGLTALAASKTRSQEITNTTTYLDGKYPSTPVNALPSPADEDVVLSGYNVSNAIGGNPTMNNSAEFTSSGKQGGLDSTVQRKTYQLNMEVRQQEIDRNQETITLMNRQLISINKTVGELEDKKAALLATGVDSKDPRITNIVGQINQQLAIEQTIDQRIIDLNTANNKLKQENETDYTASIGLA